MPGQYTGQMNHVETQAGREIKASAHYAYIQNGITLDGSKFAANELVVEGQCLVKDNTTGKYEKYSEATAGTFPAGKSDAVILDTSVRINGDQNDVIVGAVLVHGAVHKGMLKGYTAKFEEAARAIRFV